MLSEGEQMKIFLCFLMLAAFAGLAMADGDVTGKWSGSFNMTGPNGEMKESTAMLVLKQSGTDITGTVGPNEGEQIAIQKGKIEGAKITLEAEHDGHSIKFDLVLAADRITGDANMSGEGQAAKAKLDVTRSK
jgi:hypothetical protein